MATNSTGKQVARAASTGGGRTYRGQAPVNWYAGLVLIVVVGLLLVGFSRYENGHPDLSSSGSPTTSDTWHAALAVDVCGTMEPDLPAKASTTSGLTTNGTGVVTVAPMNTTESGGNATLGTFVSKYAGLTLTSTTLKYPGKPLVTNGQTCAKGTPDAGKQGFVIVEAWPNFASKTGTEVSGDPRLLKFANAQLITIGFLPAGADVPKPSAPTITALIKAVSGTSSTTTTTPGSPTTTPGSTTTTVPPKAGSTTTVVPKATTTTGVPPKSPTTTVPRSSNPTAPAPTEPPTNPTAPAPTEPPTTPTEPPTTPTEPPTTTTLPPTTPTEPPTTTTLPPTTT